MRTEVLIGRGLWVASMRHLLSGKATNALSDHRWSIVEPHGDEEWLLTDHPVLRLNYYGKTSYDFRGGWANPGTELIMPLSPHQLLYVKVGEKAPNRFAFSREQTRLVQRFLAEKALRWIFARSPKSWVAKVRPRVVDPAMFAAEEEQWKRWNEEHREAELFEPLHVESKDDV